MKLQTKLPVSKAGIPIDYKSKLLLLGSCFAENIGSKLAYFKFQQLQNPFGILFHPKAVEQLLERTVNKAAFTEDDIFYQGERWQSFQVHSSLSNTEKEQLLTDLNNRLQLTHNYLRSATHIVLTLGTAWVYRHNKSDSIVANCHKIPQSEFSKFLLSGKEVVASLERIVHLIRSINSSAELICTVSPVRHLKDGFVENQRSKAHLISALHHFCDSEQLWYYPAYEIMMDELRDYRFYAEDMIHPNTIAIDYIWAHFRAAWIAADVQDTMDKVKDVQSGLQHTPFAPESVAHQKFKAALDKKIAYLQKTYPFMEF